MHIVSLSAECVHTDNGVRAQHNSHEFTHKGVQLQPPHCPTSVAAALGREYLTCWMSRASVPFRLSEIPTGPSDSVANTASRCTCGWVVYPLCLVSELVGGCGDAVHRVSLLGAICVAPMRREAPPRVATFDTVLT